MEEVIFQETDLRQQAAEPLKPKQAPENGKYRKLVEHCLKLYNDFKDSPYRKAMIEKIIASREAYAQKEKPTSFPWPGASNIVLPLLTITIDNLEPRLVAGITGREPIVNLTMQGRSDKDEFVQVISDWYNRELTHFIKINDFVRRFCHRLLLEGTVFPLPAYGVQRETQRDFAYDPQTGQPALREDGLPAVQDEVIDVGEGGSLDLVDFTDLYYPDNVGTVQAWEECDKIRMIHPTYAELFRWGQDQAAGWMNIGPWLCGHKQSSKQAQDEADPVQIQREVDEIEVTGKETVPCIECHVSYPIYQDQEKDDETEQTNWTEEKIIVTISLQTGTIIRFKLNREIKFKNDSAIKRVRLFADDTRSCGEPVYTKLKGILEGGSNIFNMLVNISFIVMMPFFFYEDRSGVGGQKQIFPGAGIKVDSVQGILFPNFNINPAQFTAFFQVFMQLWEKVGHISDVQMGRIKDNQNTATEAMLAVQEGNIQYNYQSTTLKDEFITVLQALYDLYYQYMPLNKTFKTAKGDVPIPRQFMKQGVNFTLGASTESANKLIERKENEDLLGMFGADPLMNPVKVREDVLKSYGRTDTDAYINPQVKQLVDLFLADPNIMAVVQKYEVTKQEVAAATGAGEGNGAGNPIQ